MDTPKISLPFEYRPREAGSPIVDANGERICDLDCVAPETEEETAYAEAKQAMAADYIIRACNVYPHFVASLADKVKPRSFRVLCRLIDTGEVQQSFSNTTSRHLHEDSLRRLVDAGLVSRHWKPSVTLLGLEVGNHLARKFVALDEPQQRAELRRVIEKTGAKS